MKIDAGSTRQLGMQFGPVILNIALRRSGSKLKILSNLVSRFRGCLYLVKRLQCQAKSIMT